MCMPYNAVVKVSIQSNSEYSEYKMKRQSIKWGKIFANHLSDKGLKNVYRTHTTQAKQNQKQSD